MMKYGRFIRWCDRVMAFSFYALIYFLPISIALVESWAVVSLLCFFVKRGVVFWRDIRAYSGKVSLIQKGAIFLKSFKPVDSYLNLPIGIFIFACFLSVVTSQYLIYSIQGFFFKVLEWTFLYFIFIEAIREKHQIRIFLNVFLISITLIITNGLYQYWTGADFIFGSPIWDKRIASSFRMANDFGGYLVIVAPFLLSFLLAQSFRQKAPRDLQHKKSKKLLHFCLVVFLLALFISSLVCLGLTYSRGAWLGFSVALLFMGVSRKKFLIAVSLIVVFFFMVFSPQIVTKREATSASKEIYMSSTGRDSYWKEAWHIIRDFPVLGTGLNTYSQVGSKYKITWGGYPHNCYLHTAVELGFLGLASFLWVIVEIYRNSFRNMAKLHDRKFRIYLRGLLSGLFGFLVHSFFDTNFYSVQLGNFMWVIMGVIVAIQKIELDSPLSASV